MYSAVLVVCILASMPGRYPDWLECRMLDMRIWWRLTSFAVGDGTVDVMTSLDIDDIVWVHSFWWYCIPASWHFAVHPHLPIKETKWQLTWVWHVWYFICATHVAKVNIMVIIQRWSEYNTNVLEYEYDYFEHAWVRVLRKQTYSSTSTITLECTRVRVRLL